MQRDPAYPNLVMSQAEVAKMEGEDYYNNRTREDAKPADPNDKTLLDGSDLLSGGGYNAFWVDPGKHVALVRGEFRSSWIVEPANGRIPRKGVAAPAGRPAAGAPGAPTAWPAKARRSRPGASSPRSQPVAPRRPSADSTMRAVSASAQTAGAGTTTVVC